MGLQLLTLLICLEVHVTKFHSLLFDSGLLGHKGPQRITNWGLASFTDIELELRKKSWQERKNQGAQAQWTLTMPDGSRADPEDSDCIWSNCHIQSPKRFDNMNFLSRMRAAFKRAAGI